MNGRSLKHTWSLDDTDAAGWLRNTQTQRARVYKKRNGPHKIISVIQTSKVNKAALREKQNTRISAARMSYESQKCNGAQAATHIGASETMWRGEAQGRQASEPHHQVQHSTLSGCPCSDAAQQCRLLTRTLR
ncbi:hypothetical protein TRVL_10126 [Trypanosoma vivax]|nr:hypothetical protein TRVL_10126 [Trypanosoma vivax]